MSTKIQTPGSLSEMPLVVVTNMANLAASSFGVVVALAWNEVIQKAVADYIDPYLGKNSGMISLLIYAIIMTVLAIFITMQLSTMEKQLKRLAEKQIERDQKKSRSDDQPPAIT